MKKIQKKLNSLATLGSEPGGKYLYLYVRRLAKRVFDAGRSNHMDDDGLYLRGEQFEYKDFNTLLERKLWQTTNYKNKSQRPSKAMLI